MRRFGPYRTRRHAGIARRPDRPPAGRRRPTQVRREDRRNSAPTAAATISASVKSFKSPTARGHANIANVFGLLDGHVAFFSHCGSRGWATIWPRASFARCNRMFEPLETSRCPAVIASWSTPRWAPPRPTPISTTWPWAANFATVNHLLINSLVLEAFQEVLPGVTGQLVYFISHNIARKERYRRPPGVGPSQGRDSGVSRRPLRAASHAVRRHRPSDPAAGKSASRFGRHGRRRGRPAELL